MNTTNGAPRPPFPPTADERPFREPWEAHAFALTLQLHERGLFTWPEWAEALAVADGTLVAVGPRDAVMRHRGPRTDRKSVV